MNVSVLIVMKNNKVVEILTSDDKVSVMMKLEEFDKRLLPYYDDAVYYGQEKTYLDGDKYQLLYKRWVI